MIHEGVRRVAVRQVRGNRVAEEKALLRDVTDLRAQHVQRQLVQRNAVHQDVAFLRIAEARDEVDECALAAARCAHHRERTARGHGERQVSQHPPRLGALGRGVVKAHVAERDGAATMRWRKRTRSLGRRDRRRGIEDVEQPRHRRRTPLEQVDHPAEGDHGPREAGEVEPEGHEGAHADGAAHHEPAARAEHDGDAESCQQAEHRAHHPIQTGECHVPLDVRLVQRREARDLRLLLTVGPHHPDPSEVFLRVRGERAEVLLHIFEAPVNRAAHPDHDYRQEHHRDQRQPGESRVDAEHEHECERGPEDGIREVHDRRTGGHSHGAQVVGEPGHEVARAHPREIPLVECAEVREQRLAKVVLDVAAQAVEHLTHPVAERATSERHGDDARRYRHDAAQGCRGQQGVDTGSQQPGHHGADCR